MKCVVLLQLFFAVLQLHCSEEVSGLKENRVPLDYLSRVREDIADQEGIPKDLDTAPTIIHCLQDKAVVGNEFREKPVGEEETECEAIGRFLFDWEAVADTMLLTLSKSILRPYVQVASELLDNGEVIPVNISISLQLYHKNMTLDKNSTSFQLVQTINVTSDSEGWMELDISAFVSAVWSPMYKQSPIIEITLKMEVDCVQHMKIPIEFVNPAEVETEDTILRAQCINRQPLLLVYFDDPLFKQVLKDEEKLVEQKKKLAAENVNSLTQHRKKRNSRRADCKLGNFTLHLNELLVPADFIIPQKLNLHVCSGDCSYVDILRTYPPPTYHSRMIAISAYHKEHNLYITPNSIMYSMVHKDPCCSPIKYYSVYLVTSVNKSIRMLLYPDMIAAECECT